MGPQMVVYNGCNTARKSNLSPFFFFSQEQTTQRNLRKRERAGEDNETTAAEATLPCNTVVRQSYMHGCSKHALVTFLARTQWSVPLKRRANSLQYTFAAELCVGRNLFTTVAFETPVLTPVKMCTRRQFAHHNQPFTKAAISPDFHCEAKTHRTFSTRQPLQLVCTFQIANVYQGFNLNIINLDITKWRMAPS